MSNYNTTLFVMILSVDYSNIAWPVNDNSDHACYAHKINLTVSRKLAITPGQISMTVEIIMSSDLVHWL